MTDFMTMKASKVEQASFMWSKVNSQASTEPFRGRTWESEDYWC